MPIDEKIGELRATDGKFRMAVEGVRNTFERMKLDGNARIAELLNKALTALNRNRGVLHSVEDDSWRKSCRNI